MKIAVWDTYVKREDGRQMHFDILVPTSTKDENDVFSYGLEFLKTKPFQSGKISAKECRFCHIEKASSKMIDEIQKKGFYIIEMENCN